MEFDESYLKSFFDLLEQPRIKDFIEQDQCKVIADNYLLVIVFIFLRRTGLPRSQYNRKNFYLALYLSHELNEDIDDLRDDIIQSYLGPTKQYVRRYHEQFLNDRFVLLMMMKFNGYVRKSLCDALMMKQPHWAWKRIRNYEHSGVFYKHIKCTKCCFG